MNRTLSAALALSVAACSVASAQNTQLYYEASADAGQTWSQRLDVLPGATVYVQVRARLVNQGTQTVLGFAGATYQPTLSNWQAGDTRLPFSSSDGSGVAPDPPTNTGRLAMFASSGMGTGSRSGLLTSHVDPGGILRFAGANATTMTTNLTYGVASGQIPPSVGMFQHGTDVRIFRYAVTLDPTATQERVLATSAPIEGVFGGRGLWYRTDGGTNSLIAPVNPLDTTSLAFIHVIPSPSVLGAGVFGSFMLISRRRRS